MGPGVSRLKWTLDSFTGKAIATCPTCGIAARYDLGSGGTQNVSLKHDEDCTFLADLIAGISR
jgi:hypothetical protein